MLKQRKIHSLQRAISKLGYCSRSNAIELILSGKVRVNSKICRDPRKRVNLLSDKIEIENQSIIETQKIYIALNKPRGLITTTSDEKNRDTVYKCFEGKSLPYIFPVGRLDKASEGLLFFTNDTNWANEILNPESRIEKVYYVQVNKILSKEDLRKIKNGIVDKRGEKLSVKSIKNLRFGVKNSWLEIVLDEGKNRHIRRIFETLGIEVLRLIRVAIGEIKLGNLKKGEFRFLSKEEVNSFLKDISHKDS